MHASSNVSGTTMHRLWAIIAITAILALSLYSAGLTSYLPWLVLAACPLLHLLTHRHHGHSKEHALQDGDNSPEKARIVSPSRAAPGEFNRSAE